MKNGNSNVQLMEGLNDAFNRELTTVIRYMLQGSAIRGRQNEPLRQLYRSEVQDEIQHAQYLADKIVTLGGTPVAKPSVEPLAEEVSQMVRRDVEAEESDVSHYQRLAGMAGEAGDIELKLKMEEQAADESRHAEQLRRLQVQ